MKVYGWDPVKLSDAYTLAELAALREQVAREHAYPVDANGSPLNGSLYLHDPKGRRKLDALSWAVTHRLSAERAECT